MSTSSHEDGDSPAPKPSRAQVILMFGTMADTTWRMFVPIISLTLLGLWADNSWRTKPWLTILGIIIGTVIAGFLVKRQLQKVKK